MPELETSEQALNYLREVYPSKEFAMHPFQNGWVCKEIIPEEESMGRGLGMASLVIDKDTGIVTVQSSLATETVAEQYAEAKQRGVLTPGRQIYPHRWRIALRRIREDSETIEYEMTVTSLADPPEPTRQHPLVIEKHTYRHNPTDSLSSLAMSHAEWVSRQNNGVWPETATTED